MSKVVRIAVPAIASIVFMAFAWWMAWKLDPGQNNNGWGYVLMAFVASVAFAAAATDAAGESRS